MTAGSYADAARLVERSAAAYAAAVPVTPQDEGFFGPAIVEVNDDATEVKDDVFDPLHI